MTTIKVSVKNKRDANLLIRLLRRVSFVDQIEEVDSPTVTTNQVDELTIFLNRNSDASLFSDIQDPVAWQKKLRDEWE